MRRNRCNAQRPGGLVIFHITNGSTDLLVMNTLKCVVCISNIIKIYKRSVVILEELDVKILSWIILKECFNVTLVPRIITSECNKELSCWWRAKCEMGNRGNARSLTKAKSENWKAKPKSPRLRCICTARSTLPI